jgi:transposase-like protein
MMICPQCDNSDEQQMTGVEVRGIYDGVLFWVCESCGSAFPRDHGFPYRNIQSEIYAEKYNVAEEAGDTVRFRKGMRSD